MKAKHRHELKTNELAEWLLNLPQWAKQNLRTIIYVSALIIIVVGAYFWKRYEKNVVMVQRRINLTDLMAGLSQQKLEIIRAQQQERDYSFMLIQVADKLQDGAPAVKNDWMAALALIKRGEALRAELHYRLGAVGKREVTAQMAGAKTAYTEAATLAAGNPSLVAAARFGEGLCEEELGNFEQAQQVYRAIIGNPLFEGTLAAGQAAHRLDIMADYRQKVVFRPPPKQPSTEPLQPEMELKAPDLAEETQAPNSTSGTGLVTVADSNVVWLQGGENSAAETVKR
jgi:tetratricopeptide (TPR) repeat protein